MQKHGSLGRRFVTYILLTSACFTLLASVVQLYEMYSRDRASILKEIEIVESSFKDGLQAALWEFNFDQVALLLGGIFAQPDVAHVNLAAPTGQSWDLGTPPEGEMHTETYALNYTRANGQVVPVGTLHVSISFAQVWTNLQRQIITIALTNFVRTFAVALLIFVIFHRVVARPLRQIAGQIAAEPWLKRQQDIQINRGSKNRDDEIDLIVNALNHARQETQTSFDQILAQRDRMDSLIKDLRNASREQSEFTYAISHDLKSPADTLEMLFHELSEGDVQNNPKLVKEISSDIQKTLDRMRSLIQGVLQYSQTLEQVDGFEDVDMDDELAGVLEDLSADIRAAKATVTSDKLGRYHGNPLQLRMLLQNLISNGIKYRKPDVAPDLHVKKLGDTGAKNGVQTELSFAVSDNGIGIEPEFSERIFGLFQRLHTRKDAPGDGIGLAICRRIALNHNGDLTLDDHFKDGASFHVELGKTDGTRTHQTRLVD